MAIRCVKRGKSEAQRAEADARVEASVRGILADIRQRGDAAVRELSQQFRQLEPGRFQALAR